MLSDNYLVTPLASTLEFIQKFEGKTPINQILIANNGIAAVKFIRSIRHWAYETFGRENEIKLLAMATTQDINANAEYIKMADHYVEVQGGPNYFNYANVDLIVDIAVRMKCQAVWPGWGHSSENPRLPDLLAQHGIIFIGPPSNAMRLLGDKIASTIVAQSADVPTIAWSGGDLVVDMEKDLITAEDGEVSLPASLYRKAEVLSCEEGLEACKKIGYPVMIKASEGGGGKGIRKCENEIEFPMLFAQVQGEVKGSPIFIMKLVTGSRHLEVQLLGDNYGEAISLFGRDCSVQRRHQKIIEEAPASIAKPEVFLQMEQAAVRLAKLVKYASTGTIEYLYDTVTDKFYFLELNPRLQVEHPCTEVVCDINLPAAQLQVAMGVPLHRIADIRSLYGHSRWGTDKIDFSSPQKRPSPRGHVIASRITAENPDEGFKPSGGLISELNFRSYKNVWGYFSVSSCGSLHEFADSQFGHIFAWGETRERAILNLVMVLKQISIRGDFRTPVEYLIKLLESPDFKNNQIHTKWLDQLIENNVRADRPPIMDSLICATGLIVNQRLQKVLTDYKSAYERGQIMEITTGGTTSVDLISEGVKYLIHVTQIGPTQFTFTMNNSSINVVVHTLSDKGTLISAGKTTFITYMKEEVDQYVIDVNGATAIFQKENDASILRTTSPGKLIKYLFEDGTQIMAGCAYAEVEVMKVYMTLISQESGIIKHTKQPGAVLETGDVLATLTLDDPEKTQVFTVFESPYDQKFQDSEDLNLNQLYTKSLQALKNILAGYRIPENFAQNIKTHVNNLKHAIQDPSLPVLQITEILSALVARISPHLTSKIKKLLVSYQDSLGSFFSSFPALKIMEVISEEEEEIARTDPLLAQQFRDNIKPLYETAVSYNQGVWKHERQVLCALLEDYLAVESLFNSSQPELQVLIDLREVQDGSKVFDIAWAHYSSELRCLLVLELLDWISKFALTDDEKEILERLASLSNNRSTRVALAARKVLISSSNEPSWEVRRLHLETLLAKAIEQKEGKNLEELITNAYNYFDVLTSFFYHSQIPLRMASLEIYVRRAFSSYKIAYVRHLNARTTTSQFNFIEFSIDTKSVDKERCGAIIPFDSISEITSANLDLILGLTQMNKLLSTDQQNFLQITLPANGFSFGSSLANVKVNDDLRCSLLLELFKHIAGSLQKYNIYRVTFCLMKEHEKPSYFTYIFHKLVSGGWQEGKIFRHLEEGMIQELELDRLKNYEIDYVSGSYKQHIYYATKDGKQPEKRFFVRLILNESDLTDMTHTGASINRLIWGYQSEKLLVETLSALEIVRNDPHFGETDCNHILLNLLPVITGYYIEDLTKIIYDMLRKHGPTMYRLRITEGEVIARLRPPGSDKIVKYRYLLQNQAGFLQRGYGPQSSLRIFTEHYDEKLQEVILTAVDRDDGVEEKRVVQVHSPGNRLQFKRHFAQTRGTTYVHDYPSIFQKVVSRAWRKLDKKEPKCVMVYKELILENGQVVEVEPRPAVNTVAMVAWRLKLFTPEYPEGRESICVANDITIDIGSFAIEEDELYLKVSELARKEGIPRIYISVNSGARIGLADEMKYKWKIAWKNPENPSKGFNYIYLSEEDYLALNKEKEVVVGEFIEEEGERRYRITDIIGAKNGIGVENLKASGMIAGETSRAYDETFTISLVTCRSVGIGAYLVRLGQRVVQVESSTILLTGAAALNKLLGRNVYNNNHQIGGPQIMYTNGVSHLSVSNDVAGIEAIIHWLSYVPKSQKDIIPIIESVDPIDREIDFVPSKEPYDPRWMLAGRQLDNGIFEKGFFDKSSFTETMGGWAKNVIVGRARIGGLPMGVIAVETRSTETRIPSDPADLESKVDIISNPGQVWFPNSAFKTAQAIKDMNKEQLPLMIFANWRGFSGGVRDMFEEILKYGAFIVDNLVGYKQPVFVYIPPNAELRGGAWVVVDPQINPDFMEMYADRNSRGGILEPDGTVEIKFRKRDLVTMMLQTDEEYSMHNEKLNSFDATKEEKLNAKMKLLEREKLILPHYTQAALEFADLHDTPGRMKRKNVVLEVLDWKNSRKYFYWRIHRRVLEERIIKQILEIDSSLQRKEIFSMLQELLPQINWQDNQNVTEMLKTPEVNKIIEEKLENMKTKLNKSTSIDNIMKLVAELTSEQRSTLKENLEKLI